MAYGHAVLGETPELFKETEEWVSTEMKKLERNERARKQVIYNLCWRKRDKN